MGDRINATRYLENWQDEVDSAAEYRAMAAGEPDPRLAKVYANLAAMEESHIAFWEQRLRTAGTPVPPRRPSWRSRVLAGIARRFGPELVLSTIAAREEVNQNTYVKQPETATTRMSAQERWHARVLKQLAATQRRDNNTIVVVGLPPGQHKVLIELADPEHHIFTGQTVTFTVPGPAR
jgi:vacuolar iron transporter family protein